HNRLKYITKYQKGVNFERLSLFYTNRILIVSGRFQYIFSLILYLIWLSSQIAKIHSGEMIDDVDCG
ncbi:hypothetical protein, partial [uncultured Duncaniella sp.]|uniref:hypothetical protein n=1 Tax=uncultured Duncaniella sp. TaxID=2768039 RepID=UPI0025A65CF8